MDHPCIIKKIWMLRTLKGLGAADDELLNIYMKQIRCLLELAVPAWLSARRIDGVKTAALYFSLEDAPLLGQRYTNHMYFVQRYFVMNFIQPFHCPHSLCS